MLLFEEMGEDSFQALLFHRGQGERATFSNLSTKTACCSLAWLDMQHKWFLRGPSAQEEKNTNNLFSHPAAQKTREISVTAN